MTRRERAVGWLTGKALVYLAYKAAHRKDWHEFNHVAACISVGNSTHRKHPCPFPAELTRKPVTWEGVLAQQVGVQ